MLTQFNQGSSIRESVPTIFPFYYDQKVSNGRPGVIEMVIFIDEDPTNTGAPTYKVESKHQLASVCSREIY